MRSFGYDNAGRLTSANVTGQSGNPPALSWGYNNLGLTTSSTDALGTTSYVYDAAHRLVTRTPPSGTAATIGYNTSGLPSAISGPTSISLFYNKAGQITTEGGAGDSMSFNYDSNGRLTKATDGGATYNSATYNADGQITSLTQNPAGNPAGNTTTLGYDNAGRLSSAVLSRNGTTVSTTNYSWDADSNRTDVSTTGQPDVTTSYNHADQATADSTGASYGYDADGNLTTLTAAAGTTSYGYNGFGGLTTATTPGGTVTYTPDALGRTAVRSSGATTQTFSYNGTSTALAAQQSGGITTNLIRAPGTGQLLTEAPVGGTDLRVNPTIHGDIARLVNPSTHTTAWSAVYDPFGAATTTGTAPVSLGFQSMYTDPLTTLTDMGARSYNPASGTFTSIDSVIGAPGSPVTLNRYLYGNGDPIDSFDPTGYWSLSGLWNSFTSWLSQQWDTITSWVGQKLDSVASAASQAWNGFSQTIDTVQTDLATALHKATQVAQAYLPTIKATAASFAVGGLVFLGCEALTAGVGSLACATVSGAAGGAIYGAMMCPPASTTAHCAATGALAGGLAGLTGGLTAELGGTALAVGAVSGGTGNATAQLLATGRIDPRQLATATLTGAALGYATGALFNRPTATDPTATTDTANPASPTPETDIVPAPESSQTAPADTGNWLDRLLAPKATAYAQTAADNGSGSQGDEGGGPQPGQATMRAVWDHIFNLMGYADDPAVVRAAHQTDGDLPTVEIDAERMPNIARNVQAALNEGHPSILTRTTNEDLIDANRTAACQGFCGPESPDEYPFASTYEGGSGARVASVPIEEQHIQGGVLSSFYGKYGIGDGDPFRVIVTGLEP